MLELLFLGPPQVIFDGQRLHFPTRNALALLVYLAVEGGLHPREKLIALLWPERDYQTGRGVLRTTLAYLQKALPASIAGYLVRDGDLLGLKGQGAVRLDVNLLVEAAGREDENLWVAALASYRGDFLEGFFLHAAPAFEEWTGRQQEHCLRNMSIIFDRLSQRQMEKRDVSAGVATASRWLHHDPLQETAYRRLMQLHALAGDSAAALAVFEQCREKLRLELGVEPAPATAALAARIRRPEGMVSIAGAVQLPSHVAQERKPLELPFTGREIQHAQLVNLFQQCLNGQPQVVAITGEAGIGKTRLAVEFMKWCALQGADILTGRAFESGGRLPYQPLIDALRARVEVENAPEDLLSDVWLVELSRLLPELRDRYPDLSPPVVDPQTDQMRLLESVFQFFLALGRRRPVVYLVDDMQWADEATLNSLPYLLRRCAEDRIPFLLLLTTRAEVLALSPALSGWLLAVGREASLTRLPLTYLTQPETEALIMRLVTEPAGVFSRWLFLETKGQPFYIHETCTALIGRSLLQEIPSGGGFRISDGPVTAWEDEVPAGIREHILHRWQQLPAGAYDLLVAAAVLGRECSFSRLVVTTGMNEREGLVALDAALNSYLLVQHDEVRHPYRCAHDKIREVIYAEAGPARRQIFHRRAFSVLENEKAPPAEIAYHALAAGLKDPAYHYSLAAGNAAMAVFAIADAVRHYEQARVLVTNRAKGWADLYQKLARAYELLARHDEAQAVCREMLIRAQAEENAIVACAALNRLASIAIYTHRLAEAGSLLEEAWQYAVLSGDLASRANTSWSRGQLAHHQGDFFASRDYAEEALAIAPLAGDEELLSGILNTLGFAYLHIGNVGTAGEKFAEATRRFKGSGNKVLEADSLVGLSAAQLLQGNLPAGIATARKAYNLGREINNAFGMCMSRSWLIFGLGDEGALAEAQVLAEENWDAARPQGGPPVLVASYSRFLVYMALEQPGRAQAAIEAGIDTILASGVENYQAQAEVDLCAAALLAGHGELALLQARKAIAHQSYSALPLIYCPLWAVTAALLHGNEIEAAQNDVQNWEPIIAQVSRYQSSIQISRSLLAYFTGKPQEGRSYFEKVMPLDGESIWEASIFHRLNVSQWEFPMMGG